ncbi:MAG: bifunctional alpha,alpha-trehalose-phosphate synthase (UDP-forming)/trehalose-phosphatase [Candidatus Wallbacteria bacterium]|nr:bifunctional alpha,alpha-trehalose-phosphate synthase (UDP-forming)/trehalose-phosphatase [Candidatus Wallbacteria bacterium]
MKFIIVSNRLPITLAREKRKIKFHKSSGGLATGMRSYLASPNNSIKEKGYFWVGWPGISAEKKLREHLKADLIKNHQAYPIFLSQKVMDEFYLGFCNKTIWPLFQYFPSLAVYKEKSWQNYRSVNMLFRDAILEIMDDDDIVWVHDYHLMLLPKLIREKKPDAQIGFFLHIPFPSFEIFRLLPTGWRREILEGLLGANLIGFHTQDYTQYFLRCVSRILGHENNFGRLTIEDRIVKAKTFPMGIDYDLFYKSAGTPEVREEIGKLRSKLGQLKAILSVDRLDYVKGIINRLEAFELFLEKNPQWHGKVSLFMVIVPSRVEVEQYHQLKKQIDEYVGRLNGKYSTIHWNPVIYQFRSLSFKALSAVYGISDVALITPLRDGMNLVAKEYLASHGKDGDGVLILSEMAGAAPEMREAIIVNPNHRDEIAAAIKNALEMPKEEQISRNRPMLARLQRYNIIRWAEDFCGTLVGIRAEQDTLKARLISKNIRNKLCSDFNKSERRAIFLDYDGTLVPFAKEPSAAIPTQRVLKILKELTDIRDTEVIIVTGRDRKTLDKWFPGIKIGFVAEHGAWLKMRGSDWILSKPMTCTWKEHIYPILQLHVDRLPGSFIEEKDFSLVWHYRMADQESASLLSKELTDQLVNFTANIDVQIMSGNKVVEVRNAGVNKGSGAMDFMLKENPDFIMAAGDDVTDEDLFRVLPPDAYSIRIGMDQSIARFNLVSCSGLLDLLENLITASQSRE